MYAITHFIVVLFLFLGGLACCGGLPDPAPPSTPNAKEDAKDIDGHTYKVVVIGSQHWMASNLRTTTYRDGTPIPKITDGEKWRLASGGGFCEYDNHSSHTITYGLLYNWLAVETGRLCPTGWHVPSVGEWMVLEASLGESNSVGGKLKETGTAHWLAPNSQATNLSGFTGLPGGNRTSTGGYYSLSDTGYFWTRTEGSDPAYAHYRYLGFNSGFLFNNEDYKLDGMSVRCLKD